MLCTCMMLGVVCEGDCALVVAMDDVLVADVVADFFEKAVEPDKLFEGVEESHVFRFCAREGDRCLLLRGVGDSAACQGKNKSRD